jgi:hypothetical protein
LTQNWYFRNRSKTWGPFSTPEIKNLAAAGLLQSHDLLWPEEGDSRQATPAGAALDFLSLDCVAVPAPDWLDDVQEGQGPRSKPAALDWLADVGRWEALEHHGAKPSSERAEPKGSAVTTLIVPEPETPIPVARPVASSEKEPTLRERVPEEPTNKVVSSAPPSGKATACETAEPRTTVLRLMGFDPQTGQILDHKKFREWKNEQKKQAIEPSQPGKSIQEIFQDARRAVEGWVDEDHNRELIMTNDWDTMRRDAKLQKCLDPYRAYGSAMLDKLWHHLEFIVENRRKFYAASTKNGECARL